MNIIKKHKIKLSFYLLLLLLILTPLIINKTHNNHLDKIEIPPFKYSVIEQEINKISSNPKYNKNQKGNIIKLYSEIKSDGRISLYEEKVFLNCCKNNLII